MATPRKSPYEKAYSRALKLQVRSLFCEVSDEGLLERTSAAWEKVAALHGPCEGPGLCEWCDRFPDPLG